MNSLDNIAQTFQWAGQRYMNIMQPLAEKIFFGLVLIELIITCVHFVADQDQPARLFAEFLKKSLALGFLYAMIANAPVWFNALLNGFSQLAGSAAGVAGLSPSTIFQQGLTLFQTIYRGFASLGWFHLTMASLIALVAGLIMFLSFVLVAGQMLLALSEAYVGLGGGVILLGFSGSRWTIKFAENFIGWIVGVGVKLFFLYLLVGVGMTITAGWNSALTGWTVADPTLQLTIAGGALVFMLLSWEIPNVAARIAGSSVSLNLAHAFEAGMAGYGLGRILKSRDSSDAQPAATPLAQNLEAGEKQRPTARRRPPNYPRPRHPPTGPAAPAVLQTRMPPRSPAEPPLQPKSGRMAAAPRSSIDQVDRVRSMEQKMATRATVLAERIEQRIFFLRGQKVMLSPDLAHLYNVEPRALIQAVKRNLERFPDDFMFQLNDEEFVSLKSQIVTSSWGGLRRAAPYAFTEQGVSMLSSVLRSKRAIQVNVEIMRAFVRLRQMLASHADLARKLDALEKKYDTQFKVVFDAIRELMTPPQPNRRSLGFRAGNYYTHGPIYASETIAPHRSRSFRSGVKSVCASAHRFRCNHCRRRCSDRYHLWRRAQRSRTEVSATNPILQMLARAHSLAGC